MYTMGFTTVEYPAIMGHVLQWVKPLMPAFMVSNGRGLLFLNAV